MQVATAGFAQTYATTSQRIADALRREWGGARSAVKVAARAVGVSDRTFQNWWQARSEPRAAELVAMMAASPEVCATMAAAVIECRIRLGRMDQRAALSDERFAAAFASLQALQGHDG